MSIDVKFYCDICNEYIPRSAISMYQVTQYDNKLVMSTTPKKLDVCYKCMGVMQRTIAKDKLFSAYDVMRIMTEHGQHDPRFRLGETIKYNPEDVKKILEEHKE